MQQAEIVELDVMSVTLADDKAFFSNPPQQGICAEPLLSMSCHSSCAAPSVHLIFPVIEIEEGQLVSFQLALAYLLLHLLHPFPYG